MSIRSQPHARPGAGRRPFRALPARLAAACLLPGLAMLAAGCGEVKGGDDANLISGKKMFVAKCGSCHTLARADTKGIVGPNLDEAFRASIHEGLERSTIRGVVEYQIENPNPIGAMPKNLVSGAARKDIAAYVSQVAALPGNDTGLLASAVEAPGAGKPAVEKGGKLTIPANPTGQLAYATNKASATPGAVTIEMPNMSGVSHNIAIEAGEHGASGTGPVLGASSFTAKGVATVSVSLKPGTYTYFCEAPGHRAAGMFGTLTVK
ncbi:MAG: plastocyanin/azurin family copper-binding protein [Solirubrobacteraceae bacterium]